MELLSKEDWGQEKRIITFGMGAPREADSFGIKGDMSGSLDWLAWAPPTDEYDGNRLIKARRTKKSQALEEEPLTIKQLIPADALRIRGRHNARLNALAALGFTANAIGFRIAPLLHGSSEDYEGEPHRVQTDLVLWSSDAAEYIDDSKGTDVRCSHCRIKRLTGMAVMLNMVVKKIFLTPVAGSQWSGAKIFSHFVPPPILPVCKNFY
jgi:UDP-N-acetylmuramoylalanine--D-glutamate ligase